MSNGYAQEKNELPPRIREITGTPSLPPKGRARASQSAEPQKPPQPYVNHGRYQVYQEQLPRIVADSRQKERQNIVKKATTRIFNGAVDSLAQLGESFLDNKKRYFFLYLGMALVLKGVMTLVEFKNLVTSFASEGDKVNSQPLNIQNQEIFCLRHYVKEGEDLTTIADYYNVSLQELINANPQIVNIHLIKVWDEIRIPNQC